MYIDELREFCIIKPGVEESFPFDENTLVFKVGGKMFLLVDIESRPLSFNVKCDPEKAIELRATYSCVNPGYHMNKTHWNTVTCESGIPEHLFKEWINHSYDLVVASLPKKTQSHIKNSTL